MTDARPDWYIEEEVSGFRLGFEIVETLHEEQTGLQHVQVHQTRSFGRLLVLDDCVMLTEHDEFIYHEMLAHVPLFTHPEPRRLLVVGGGDGGTLREAARHPTLEQIVLCEIDPRVTAVAREWFPALRPGLEDPRVQILHRDAAEYIREQARAFDVILVDSTDPVGPAAALFEQDFFEEARQALRDERGILAAQGESPHLQREQVRQLHAALGAVFPRTWLYQAHIPMYPSGWWSFALATLGLDPQATEVHERIRAAALPTRYHCADVHRAAFALPPCVRELLP
jgi:spermidine synthase